MRKLICLAFAALFTFACSKSSTEEKKGCIEKNATNYCSSCTKDDGTCEYSGKVVLWFGQTVQQNLQNAGVQNLKYYVNGTMIASESTTYYWTGAPDCGQLHSVTLSQNWKSATTKTLAFEAKSDNGTVIYSGDLNFQANVCVKTELLP